MSDHWFELGVLVGYGSIGRAHARVLGRYCRRLVVADHGGSAREAARLDHPEAVVVASLDEVIATESLGAAVVVIATWGPSHADVFERVIGAGCRRVLCEKPIADSIARGAAMVASAEVHGVALAVNYVRRQGREAEGLRSLAERFELGPAVSIVAHGGARGLVTNGIHTVELACDVLGADPVAVVSSARGEHVNPRSDALSFFGGSAIWTFPGGRELVVSYPLGSSLKEHLFVYHRDAVVVVADGASARVHRRPPGDVAAHPAVTFTGFPSETLWDDALPSVVGGDERIAAALRAVRDGDAGVLRPEHHLRALGACIGALESGATGARVDLPVDPESELGRRRWAIS